MAQHMVRGLSSASGEEDHRRALEAAEVLQVHLLGRWWRGCRRRY